MHCVHRLDVNNAKQTQKTSHSRGYIYIAVLSDWKLYSQIRVLTNHRDGIEIWHYHDYTNTDLSAANFSARKCTKKDLNAEWHPLPCWPAVPDTWQATNLAVPTPNAPQWAWYNFHKSLPGMSLIIRLARTVWTITGHYSQHFISGDFFAEEHFIDSDYHTDLSELFRLQWGTAATVY